MSALPRILLKKSKFERPRKSRESRFLDIPPAAKPCREDTNVRGRFCVKRCGPSYRRVRNASAVQEIFVVTPKRLFQHYLPEADIRKGQAYGRAARRQTRSVASLPAKTR